MRVLSKRTAMAAVVVSASLIGFSGVASAQNGGPAGSGPNPYSDCGIGAAIFKNDAGASISNVIWDLGTTAVISAVSSPETCEGKEVAAAQFIYETYASLEEQTARGEGEHLSAVLDILACDVQQQQEIVTAVRTDFSSLVAKSDYSTMSDLERSEQFYNIVMTNSESKCDLG